MKAQKYLSLALPALALWSLPVLPAEWYTATGTAAIVDGVAAAREEAVNDAVRNVLLQAGATIDMETLYSDGVMVKSDLHLRSNKPIRKIDVMEEEKTANRITVRVRVLVDEKRIERCAMNSLRKILLPITFRYSDQRAYQSSAGIETINEELDRLLFSQLKEIPSLMVRPASNVRLPGIGEHYQDNSVNARTQDDLRAIANRDGAQYVLVGIINSVAASEVGNIFTKPFYDPTRTIDFSVSIYEASSGDQIFNKNYAGEADFPFKQGQFIDLRSDRFRGSSYAMRVRDLCDKAAKDIMMAMQCLAPSARIVEVDNDDFIIDIGRDSGIAPGMTFTIGQTRQPGNAAYSDRYARIDHTESLYRVTEVYAHSARLHPDNLRNNLINIRVNDVVVLTKREPEER